MWIKCSAYLVRSGHEASQVLSNVDDTFTACRSQKALAFRSAGEELVVDKSYRPYLI